MAAAARTVSIGAGARADAGVRMEPVTGAAGERGGAGEAGRGAEFGGARPGGGSVVNRIGGGTYLNTVIQAHTVTAHLPPPLTPAMSALPPVTPAFTGRDALLAELVALLEPPPAPGAGTVSGATAVLTGLAGVGKTELALQAAHRALSRPDWFPGGVLFLDLFGYDDERRLTPAHALDVLLRALAVPAQHIPPDVQSRTLLYRTLLQGYADEGRRVLVVLDNASTGEDVRPLLPADATTAVLVTSRHTLALHLGERLFDLNVLEADDSVALLRRLLRRSRPGDTRVDREPEQAARIAELCGGLPLALQIAAARLADAPARPLVSLAGALGDAHRRLDGLHREDRAVRAAFDLSYRVLTGRQARLFRLLALNPGPDLATEAAARLTGEDPHDVEGVLEELARAHLVGHATAYGRWRMHDLVRLYADHHGRAEARPDGREEARDRLLRHYLDTADAADALLGRAGETRTDRRTDRTDHADHTDRFADAAAAVAWLDSERANLIAAVTTAHTENRPDISVNLALTLGRYLSHRHLVDDWLTISTTALGLCHLAAPGSLVEARALLDHGTALTLARRFDEATAALTLSLRVTTEADHRPGQAQAWLSLGNVRLKTRRFQEAIACYTRAAELCRALGDRHGRAGALGNLAAALLDVRRFDEAIAVISTVVDLRGQDADRDDRADALTLLGEAFSGKRKYDRAIEVFTEAARLYALEADDRGEAVALAQLGNTLMRQWRIDEAITAHTRAADLLHALGDRHAEALARNSLGLCFLRKRRLREAVRAHTQAAEAFRDTRDRHGEGLALTNLGMALVQLDQAEQAVHEHTRAARLLHDSDDDLNEGVALNNLGCALRRVGRFADAIDAHHQAIRLFRRTGDPGSEGDALNNIGLARGESGDLAQAVTAHRDAAALYRHTHDRHGEGRASSNAAIAYIRMERFHEAVEAGREAARVFEEMGDPHAAAGAYTNLGTALIELRRYDEAADACRRALRLFRDTDDPASENAAMHNLLRATRVKDGNAKRAGEGRGFSPSG
ncbi:tetratricopeptide repeat protein [Streptomyces sp. NPDC093546]|uniref:tetratricopeptide repeat protein n=1 Tax=Streptomyces sp. NPDC093546 TaxID=3366040 RepID=UPI0038268F21